MLSLPRFDGGAVSRAATMLVGCFAVAAFIPAWAASVEPDAVVVRQAGQVVEAERLSSLAVHTLRAWLHERANRFDLGAVSSIEPLRLRSGHAVLRPRALPADAPISSRMQVWIDVDVDGRFVRSIPVSMAVSAYHQAWVATEDLRAGQRVSDGALERREVGIVGLRNPPLAELPANWRLRKPLLAGQPLTAAHVEKPPAVSRGDRVTLRSRLGDISVEARGEALQDGRPGQPVLVRLGSAREAVASQVVAPGIVELKQ